jgi:PAS domain S-box-containing protein
MATGAQKKEAADRKRKILIVDDDPHIVRLLRDKLRAEDVTIHEALNGLDAIRMSLRELPDLILLDVMMPNLDGYQVCRFVRSVPALYRTRVIFLTVKHGVGDRQRGLLRGADDYLAKPFDMEELDKKVRGQFDREREPSIANLPIEPFVDLPPPEEITDEVVFSLMNRMLDEKVHRFTLLEQVSKRLMSAVDREEILKTSLASVVSPVGLGWDRAMLMAVDEESCYLRTELAFAVGEKPEDGLARWRELLKVARDKTMEELLERGLKDFRFQSPRRSPWLRSLELKTDPSLLSLPGAAAPPAMEVLQQACGGRRIDTFLGRVFWSREVSVVPIAGRERVFGLIAADRSFSRKAVQVEDLDHLFFLCHQTGLALERQEQHHQSQLRADQFEQLSLLNESIMNSTDLGVVYLDDEGKVGTWNRGMSVFTGLGEEKVRGKEFFSLFPSLRGTLVEERYKRSRSRKNPERVGHYRCVFRKTKKGIYDIRFGVVRRGRKNVGTVMIWEDVQLRVTLEQKAQEAHRYLTNLVEHSGDAIITLDDKGKIKSWNSGAADIFGYSEAESMGKHLGLLYEKGSRREARDLISRTLEQGKVINELKTFLHKGGEPVEVSIATSTINRGEGNEADISAIVRDVSERRRMESHLFQTEKLASIGILAAGMAHEINNPLTSIMMYSQILGMSRDGSEEDRNCIEKIEEDAGRIADIVNSLLVFSRPSSRKEETVDVHETIEKAMSFIKYQTGSKNIRVHRNFSEDVPPLRGVTTEIQEIFLNLLINSRDAVCDGGEIVVSSRCHPQGETVADSLCSPSRSGFVEVSVRDDGCGIPKEDLKQIYDPFFTTKPPGKGTGLGLAVVRRLVENHQGCINVSSRAGKGTCFTVFFPADNDSGPPAGEAE